MIEMIVTIAGSLVIIGTAIGIFLWLKKRKKPLDKTYFKTEWKELQKLLRNKDRWDVALLQADNLVDIALKKSRIRGQNMGERLVKAQRLFTDNDGVWFAHKLRNRVEGDPEYQLVEKELKKALLGARQALQDLGALPDVKKR